MAAMNGKARPMLISLALGWLVLMLLLALFGGWFTAAATHLDLPHRLQPPVFFGGDGSYPLGTDELGRGMIARLIASIRISLLIGFAATCLGAAIGTSLGFLAAERRGWIEQAILALVDFQASLPFLIVALALLAIFGNSLGLFIVLMSLHGWERHARVARATALEANAQGYASAIRHLGAGRWRVYGLHILPNIAGPLIVSASLAFPEIVLLESGLSFLGLGVQPPLTSLGAMVGFGRDYLDIAPWILVQPSLVIVLTTLSVNLIGDWLRDRLDHRL
ncbi:MAG: ABC transporter permease [Acetobacteraceae bacterium]|nr:ABC transporter permease [Acetobacteraceae bacterium]